METQKGTKCVFEKMYERKEEETGSRAGNVLLASMEKMWTIYTHQIAYKKNQKKRVA